MICRFQICDPKLKILNVNARYPGARHDAYIWANSAARRVMELEYEQGERNTCVIGKTCCPFNIKKYLRLPTQKYENVI